MPRSKPIGIMPGQRWLTVHQAAAYSQVGIEKLKRLAKDGKICGFEDIDNGHGKWIFDKESLDTYRLSMWNETEKYARQKAIEIMGGIRL